MSDPISALLASVSARVGVPADDLMPALLELAKEIDGLGRAKNRPRPPWFSMVTEQFAKAMRETWEKS